MMAPKKLREERGQALVELALVLPILLVLVFGIIEFAKGFNYWDQTSQVANETARWIIVDQLPAYTDPNGNAIPPNTNPSTTDYKNYAFARLVSKDLRTNTPTGNIHICSSAAPSPTTGADVTVAIKTSYQPLAPITSSFFSSGINLKGSATMRIELPPGAAAGQFEATSAC